MGPLDCQDGARGVPLNVIQRQLGRANLGVTAAGPPGVLTLIGVRISAVR